MNAPHDPTVNSDHITSSPADSLRPADGLRTTDHVTQSVSTDGSHPGANASGDDLPAVPGYRLLSEIARGGMGRVLAAYDLTLDRDVALKVLLPGANAERFVRESKITARLPHPGIPPVHALGTLADGSPFLAMKLIAGRTLAEEMKTADRPNLLQAFTQVCQAVGFAHSRRIIHRDLKPANVMVGAFGEVQVMDWGLAKDLTGLVHGDDQRPSVARTVPVSGADTGPTTYGAAGESTDKQTQVGQVLGTPAYMAPEQARGETTDARADVFALGGILCAILTGQPPFGGKSLPEVIRRAAAADLAEANARLERCGADDELIALCRRCLSANPSDRPADGHVVADGVTAYLGGMQEKLQQAELAQAEARAKAVEEAMRRRLALALGGLVVLALVVAIVGTSIGMVRAENRRVEADQARADEEMQRQAAEQAKDLAQKNAELATKQSNLALLAFHTLVGQVQQQIGDEPGMQHLKLALLESAREGLDKVAKSDEHSRLLGQTTAGAYTQLGHVFQLMGQTEKAYAQYEKCFQITQVLLAEDPDGDVALSNVAASHTALGGILHEWRRDVQASMDHYQKALEILRKLYNRQLLDEEKLPRSRVKRDLAESYTRVGVTYLRLGEPSKARSSFQEALTLREELSAGSPGHPMLKLDKARSHKALGEIDFRDRHWPEAREHFRNALQQCEEVFQENSKSPTAKLELAHTLGNIGVFSLRTGDLDAAQKYVARCLTLMEELVKTDPANAMNQRYLGLAHYRLATLARKRNDTEIAARSNQACLTIREKLAPINESRQIDLLLVLPRCGQHARAAELAAKIQNGGDADREVLIDLAQCLAQCAAAANQKDLQQGYIDRAVAALNQAADKGFTDSTLLETDPDFDSLRQDPHFQILITRLKKS
jgi:tetratricopeptide (TPR) repeat protein